MAGQFLKTVIEAVREQGPQFFTISERPNEDNES